MTKQQEILNDLESGKFSDAEDKCQTLLNEAADDPETWHLYSIIKIQNSEFNQALDALQQAISLNPGNEQYHSNISNLYKKIGNLQLAQQHLFEALRINPNYAAAYTNLASLYYSQARYQQAREYYQKAIRLDPLNWEAHYNLGNSYSKMEQVTEAIKEYQATLNLKPDYLNAQQNLAILYCLQRDFSAAVPLLEPIVDNYPHHVEIQLQLAEGYLELGNIKLAIIQFEKVIALEPNRIEALHNLGVLYIREKRSLAALQIFEKLTKLAPENETAKHMYASLSQNIDNNYQTPTNYVQELFDQYAPYYDQHMKQQLDYKLPATMRSLYSQITPDINSKKILDLGCGTGQAGVCFSDVSSVLIGVDISYQMLKFAKSLNGYDLLCQADLNQSLPWLNYFDLVIATDVLVYFSDLANLFIKVSQAIQKSGIFMFSIEENNSNNHYIINTNGRYAHHLDYIASIANKSNFQLQNHKKVVLRKNENHDISGYIVVLQKI